MERFPELKKLVSVADYIYYLLLFHFPSVTDINLQFFY
jgi:hypothetical protein